MRQYQTFQCRRGCYRPNDTRFFSTSTFFESIVTFGSNDGIRKDSYLKQVSNDILNRNKN